MTRKSRPLKNLKDHHRQKTIKLLRKIKLKNRFEHIPSSFLLPTLHHYYTFYITGCSKHLVLFMHQRLKNIFQNCYSETIIYSTAVGLQKTFSAGNLNNLIALGYIVEKIIIIFLIFLF